MKASDRNCSSSVRGGIEPVFRVAPGARPGTPSGRGDATGPFAIGTVGQGEAAGSGNHRDDDPTGKSHRLAGVPSPVPGAGREESEWAPDLGLDDSGLFAPRCRRAGICQIVEGSKAQETEPLATRLMQKFRSGYRFTMVYLGEPGLRADELREAGFPVHVITVRAGRSWECSRRLVRILERENVDLVHAHQSEAFFYSLLARSFVPRATILVTERRRRYPEGVAPKRVAVNRLFLEPRDRVVASCHSVREALILNDGLPPGQVEVIYDGVPLPPEMWSGEDREAFRRELGLSPDALLILQPAQFETRENHTLAIQAFEQVVRTLPGARLVFAGEGPEKRMIEGLVRQRGLESQVVFLGPRVDPNRLLGAADLLLVTGGCDGTLSKLTRALAAGRPVVATRSGGVPEVVEDRTCGLIAAPGDYGALAEAIHRLGSSPALREEFGRRARERVEALFSQAATADLYSNMYRDMLSH
jgi:L-malate glycosyltransferase